MNETPNRTERRVRSASVLVVAGLVVEAGSLLFQHHFAFLLFGTVGLGLVAAGIALYLWTLAAHDPRPR